jgi:hypothetical protein
MQEHFEAEERLSARHGTIVGMRATRKASIRTSSASANIRGRRVELSEGFIRPTTPAHARADSAKSSESSKAFSSLFI